jgi:acetoin utilization deacetylase AcuC-like enzyme
LGKTNNFDAQAVILPIMKVAFAPVYKYRLPEGHRFPMEKYEILPEQLLYEGTLVEEDFFHPKHLREEDILKVHTPKYWEKLKTQMVTRKEERKIGFPMRADLVDRGRYIARGTYECALHAQAEGVSLNIAGGTHHAFADHGEGFCVFNDIAVASRMLLDEKKVRQILIVDLDVHQGNGNAAIFSGEKRVFTFSMHGAKNYPLRKPPSDMDIAWPDRTTGSSYLPRLERQLPLLIDRVKPNLIFFQSGVDVLEADKLGRLSLSIQECMERDMIVFNEAHRHQIPIVATMGGGYSARIAQIIDAHANTFRVARDLFF